MDRRRWILIPPAVWIASILLIQILGALTAPANSEMPEDCPEESRNCFRSMMGLDGTPQEVHAAAMNWVNSQNRTSVETQAVVRRSEGMSTVSMRLSSSSTKRSLVVPQAATSLLSTTSWVGKVCASRHARTGRVT